MNVTAANGSIDLDAYLRNARARESGARRAGGARPTAGRGDKVVLSPQAQTLRHARSVLDATPDVRTELVADIKFRIENGTYTVDSDKIARRMIRDAVLFQNGGAP